MQKMMIYRMIHSCLLTLETASKPLIVNIDRFDHKFVKVLDSLLYCPCLKSRRQVAIMKGTALIIYFAVAVSFALAAETLTIPKWIDIVNSNVTDISPGQNLESQSTCDIENFKSCMLAFFGGFGLSSTTPPSNYDFVEHFDLLVNPNPPQGFLALCSYLNNLTQCAPATDCWTPDSMIQLGIPVGSDRSNVILETLLQYIDMCTSGYRTALSNWDCIINDGKNDYNCTEEDDSCADSEAFLICFKNFYSKTCNIDVGKMMCHSKIALLKGMNTAFCSSNNFENICGEGSSTKAGYIIWVAVAGGLLLFFILIAIFGLFWYRRRKQFITHLAQEHNSVSYGNRVELAEMPTDKGDMTKRYQYIDQPGTSHNERFTRDAWEVSSDQLKIFNHEKLGSGAFCVVFKGKLEGRAPICNIQPSVATQCFENCEVAIKKLPEYADESAKNDFVQEIDFMKRIGYHSHLVSILGCITDPQLDPCLIIEYCCNGDLLKYVRNRRLEIVEPTVDDEKALRLKDLLSFAWQISDGMDFLSSKGGIHRDVAARNVLVDENKVAKIGDFGLCRLMDTATYTTRGGRLPIKWMALESLQDCTYTTKSDVLGAAPYSWLQPADMVDYLRSGKRLEKPDHCADNVYSIMQACWKDKPDERPFFSDLKIELGNLLSCATEEYGYLDIRKPSGGQYYRQLFNDSGSTEQSARHSAESTAPNDTVLQSEIGDATGASCKNDK